MNIAEVSDQYTRIRINDTDDIALWKYLPKAGCQDKHVLLTHGTFSNRKVLLPISEYLTNHGFTCWIFEWRNHGASSKSSAAFNFETIGKEDFKLVFDYLFEEQHISSLDCITHSGGGICLTIALSTYPEYQNKVKSISMFACQAYGASTSKLNYVKIAAGKYISKFLGRIPATKINREENESYYTMKQWFDWNISGQFIGDDGHDYQMSMKDIRIPILSIFGRGDTLIAPADACEAFLESFENPANQSLFCSIDQGYAEDYDHGRILHSRNAAKEIYPKVLQWIEQHHQLS